MPHCATAPGKAAVGSMPSPRTPVPGYIVAMPLSDRARDSLVFPNRVLEETGIRR